MPREKRVYCAVRMLPCVCYEPYVQVTEVGAPNIAPGRPVQPNVGSRGRRGDFYGPETDLQSPEKISR